MPLHQFAGHLLEQHRKAAGKSREQLAVDVGRSHQSIVAYERGRIVPPLDVLAVLAAAVDVAPGDLFELAREAA